MTFFQRKCLNCCPTSLRKRNDISDIFEPKIGPKRLLDVFYWCKGQNVCFIEVVVQHISQFTSVDASKYWPVRGRLLEVNWKTKRTILIIKFPTTDLSKGETKRLSCDNWVIGSQRSVVEACNNPGGGTPIYTLYGYVPL